ncbi:hypothetical protein TIFTF001_014284 [Ficus carica]|uniref:DDE Tnp4 domain-containing protein n=1 Tax=Ficus carica TaxID=3494 RepID=A0AA88A3H0_FICCA|nr:hypothetical protein TIFTF001_014284 [Ficus carica]
MNEYSSASEHEEDDRSSEHELNDDDGFLPVIVVAVVAHKRNRRINPQPMHNARLTGATNRHISYLFQHSRETTSRWFFKVLTAICALKDEFIRQPNYTDVQHLIMGHSYKYKPWFDDCIGVINGTHVPCVPRAENSEAWINRKGVNSQNVLAICSFDMKFTYMLAGYERSCHDARMLQEAITFHGFPIPSPRKFYVADSGYVNKDCFLSPFRRETFKILKGVNNYPMDKQVMILVACAIVHNFIRMVQVGDPILEEYATDGVPVGGHIDVNADYVLGDGVDDTGRSIESQQDASGRGAMNQLRDLLADDMWDMYQRNPLYKFT